MSKASEAFNAKLAAAVAALGAAVASGWIADGLKGECLFEPVLDACAGNVAAGLGRVLVAGAVFGLSVLFLYRLAKRLLPVKHLAWSPGVRPHRVLIAALSPLRCRLRTGADGITHAEGIGREGKTSFSKGLTGDIGKDINVFDDVRPFWPGQHFLRALRPHAEGGQLRHLVLLVSNESGGTEELKQTIEQLVSLYLPTVELDIAEPVNFEDIEGLQQRFDQWIEHFLQAGVPEPDIILDTTGGQKTTSIAAALTTLRWNRIEFQYVQTAPPYQVLGFNLAVETTSPGSPF
jgi:hypothetical protein